MKTHSIIKEVIIHSIPICFECKTVFLLLNLKINYKNELSLHYKCNCSQTKYVNYDSYYYGINPLKSLERKECCEGTDSYSYCLKCETFVCKKCINNHPSHLLSYYSVKNYIM